MATVSTTLVVNFTPTSDDAGLGLTAEIDSRPEGLNNGKTSFAPGDSVGFLVYPGPNVTITNVRATAGGIANVGAQAVSIQEALFLAQEKEARLRAPVSGISGQWLGIDPGVTPVVAGGVVKFVEEVFGMLYFDYTANAIGYILSGVPLELGGLTDFSVGILVEGEG